MKLNTKKQNSWLKNKLSYLNFTKKKHENLSNAFKKLPIFKEFAEGICNPKREWSPRCLKFATQIRYASNYRFAS